MSVKCYKNCSHSKHLHTRYLIQIQWGYKSPVECWETTSPVLQSTDTGAMKERQSAVAIHCYSCMQCTGLVASYRGPSTAQSQQYTSTLMSVSWATVSLLFPGTDNIFTSQEHFHTFLHCTFYRCTFINVQISGFHGKKLTVNTFGPLHLCTLSARLQQTSGINEWYA